ncbi:unnamed protein product [Camellia sinensis]
MEAVTRSSTRILVNNFDSKSVPLSRTPLRKSQINFFRSLILVSIPLKKTVQCVPLSKTKASKTVHVKFQLQKEYLFGNLRSTIFWAILPIGGKPNPTVFICIECKVNLWKQGGNFLETWPRLTFPDMGNKQHNYITEDWENAEAQKITELQMTNPNEELVNLFATKSIVDDSVTNLIEESMSYVQEDVTSADDIAFPEDQQTVNRIKFIVTENGTHQKQGPWVNAKAINRNQWKTTMAEKKPTVWNQRS